MKPGDKIKWSYMHYLNSQSKTRCNKQGVYYGKVKHTSKYRGNHQLAIVQFDGNRQTSRVPFVELRML